MFSSACSQKPHRCKGQKLPASLTLPALLTLSLNCFYQPPIRICSCFGLKPRFPVLSTMDMHIIWFLLSTAFCIIGDVSSSLLIFFSIKFFLCFSVFVYSPFPNSPKQIQTKTRPICPGLLVVYCWNVSCNICSNIWRLQLCSVHPSERTRRAYRLYFMHRFIAE